MKAIPSGAWTSAASLLGLVMLAGLLRRHRELRGTTLFAPWLWALFAVLAIGAVEVWAVASAARGPVSGSSPFRYAAALATFCPAIAVLGAKRPQDRGWQAIVASLWLILLVPAFSAVLFARGGFYVDPIWSWFLLILIGMGIANWLITRYWIAYLLVGAAQVLLLVEHLPGTRSRLAIDADTPSLTLTIARPLFALILLTTAIWSVHLVAYRRQRRNSKMGPAADAVRLVALDRLWLDFRDSFGMIWGLRIAERINASARMYNWKVTLRWDGFHVEAEAEEPAPGVPDSTQQTATNELTSETAAAIEKSFRTLLRRFVSPEWIDRRLGPDEKLAG